MTRRATVPTRRRAGGAAMTRRATVPTRRRALKRHGRRDVHFPGCGRQREGTRAPSLLGGDCLLEAGDQLFALGVGELGGWVHGQID